jgi:hypothetical protein
MCAREPEVVKTMRKNHCGASRETLRGARLVVKPAHQMQLAGICNTA